MLNKLDQYLIHQFWIILGLSVLGFVSIFVIVDLIENLDRFMDNQVPAAVVWKYYVYTLPYFVSIGLPMSVLISTVFSLGSMVKRNEWTAM
ncbi:MAG: LptF/LptG family permease, partial [Candidatus Neomarinimicrobiota bacterium]|nr:LptF/LptG family permease [Candidatus Neomarinimicrobiota bacterium]